MGGWPASLAGLFAFCANKESSDSTILAVWWIHVYLSHDLEGGHLPGQHPAWPIALCELSTSVLEGHHPSIDMMQFHVEGGREGVMEEKEREPGFPVP